MDDQSSWVDANLNATTAASSSLLWLTYVSWIQKADICAPWSVSKRRGRATDLWIIMEIDVINNFEAGAFIVGRHLLNVP